MINLIILGYILPAALCIYFAKKDKDYERNGEIRSRECNADILMFFFLFPIINITICMFHLGELIKRKL